MEDAEEVCRCSVCDSDDLEYLENEYETGVYAPDGYAERWLWRGYRCHNCGNKEEL
jgi:hypothetical protein